MAMLNGDVLDRNQMTTANLVVRLQQDFGPAPSLQVFQNAAQAAYDPSRASSLGLKPFLDGHGNPMSETLASGMTASAYVDGQGNIIVAYQGTITGAQNQLDIAILSGTDPAKLKGFSDALGFAQQVEAAAKSRDINQTHLYVTGHSLGGTLASYVASQTGLGGTAFASSGVPGYRAPPIPAANFVTYVEKGDPFANYATDAAERGSAAVANVRMDHYGTVVSLGTSADAAELKQFAAKISGQSIGAVLAGHSALSQAQIASLENQFFTLMGEHHNLSTYDADSAHARVSASAYGLQTTSMTQFMSSMAADAKNLLAFLPRIYSAPSAPAAIDRFGQNFPDLAREITSMMHAQTLQGAFGELEAIEPTLYTAMTNAGGLTTIIEALGHHPVGAMPHHLASM
ncbi:hypothetical protein NFI95_12935 [Acetobacteraceae bacterium KSS8]|uniref:DUF2974 domain-containing protein n=1 Tax=Endosaccharibacter trunci TaxID=2812733 RepID=A0ABT1WAS3_9PROT|nr:hypothetical protein [Acetobacteraceae bacterium KSS8]